MEASFRIVAEVVIKPVAAGGDKMGVFYAFLVVAAASMLSLLVGWYILPAIFGPMRLTDSHRGNLLGHHRI